VPYDSHALDVTDEAAVRRIITTERPELVIHCAAWTDTAGCERDPERAMLVNGTAAGYVAQACAATSSAMVFVSTNEVFEGKTKTAYKEGDRVNPINEYGRSKLAGEEAVRAALDARYIVRTSWVYGPGRASFPEKILERARVDGSVRLVTDETAAPTWTHDLAIAIGRLIHTLAHGTYHLSNAGACSRKAWGEEVLRLAGLDVPIEETTQAEFDLPYRKPVVSTLANKRAASYGITLRPWQDALQDHMRITGALASAGTQA